MTSGSPWIKLHRKIKENFCSKDPEAFALWVHLLLLANHKPNTWLVNGCKVDLKSGEFATGRISLSEVTGLKQNKIYRLLNMFEEVGQIRQQKTNKYTIISITNWHKYQINEQQTENKSKTNQTQTENKSTQTKRIRKIKNEKNDKNNYAEKVFSAKPKKSKTFFTKEQFDSECQKLEGQELEHFKRTAKVQGVRYPLIFLSVEDREEILTEFQNNGLSEQDVQFALEQFQLWAEQNEHKMIYKKKVNHKACILDWALRKAIERQKLAADAERSRIYLLKAKQ
jgi:hypothetical protein